MSANKNSVIYRGKANVTIVDHDEQTSKNKKGKKKEKKLAKQLAKQLKEYYNGVYLDGVKHLAALATHAERTEDWLSEVVNAYPLADDEAAVPDHIENARDLVDSIRVILSIASAQLAHHSEVADVNGHDKAFTKGAKGFTTGYPKVP